MDKIQKLNLLTKRNKNQNKRNFNYFIVKFKLIYNIFSIFSTIIELILSITVMSSSSATSRH